MNNLEKKFKKFAGLIDLTSKIPTSLDFNGFLEDLAEIADTYWFNKLKRMAIKPITKNRIIDCYDKESNIIKGVEDDK